MNSCRMTNDDSTLYIRAKVDGTLVMKAVKSEGMLRVDARIAQPEEQSFSSNYTPTLKIRASAAREAPELDPEIQALLGETLQQDAVASIKVEEGQSKDPSRILKTIQQQINEVDMNNLNAPSGNPTKGATLKRGILKKGDAESSSTPLPSTTKKVKFTDLEGDPSPNVEQAMVMRGTSGIGNLKSTASKEQWHRRLSHAMGFNLEKTAAAVEGMEIGEQPKEPDCLDCLKYKMTAQSFHRIRDADERYPRVLYRVHSDIGYYHTPSKEGYNTFVTFVDYHTRYTWAYPMKERPELEIIFKIWLARVQQETGQRADTIVADLAGEYRKEDLKMEVALTGCKLNYAVREQHQQNGLAENSVNLLKTGIDTTLAAAKLGPEHWPHAMAYLVWSLNRTVHTTTKGKTPFENYYKKKPNLALARPWGCMGLFYVPKRSRTRGEGRARWGIFMGMAPDAKAWMFLPIGQAYNKKELTYATGASFLEHWTVETYQHYTKESPKALQKLLEDAETIINNSEDSEPQDSSATSSDLDAEGAQTRAAQAFKEGATSYADLDPAQYTRGVEDNTRDERGHLREHPKLYELGQNSLTASGEPEMRELETAPTTELAAPDVSPSTEDFIFPDPCRFTQEDPEGGATLHEELEYTLHPPIEEQREKRKASINASTRITAQATEDNNLSLEGQKNHMTQPTKDPLKGSETRQHVNVPMQPPTTGMQLLGLTAQATGATTPFEAFRIPKLPPELEELTKPLLWDKDVNAEPVDNELEHFKGTQFCLWSHNQGYYVANFYASHLSCFFGAADKPTPQDLPKEPQSLKEAMESEDWPRWKAAMEEELQTLGSRKTWELVELPANKKAIGVKWVLVVKTTAKGEVERFKARLVAKGFNQVQGRDFDKTYAPVSRYTSFRMLVALGAANGFKWSQLDVKNAFLYGQLDETELYMQQPPGFEDGTDRVCKLLKSIYGLKQAPLVWYTHIEQFLKSKGWKPLDTDWALFISPDSKSYLLLYVDDILIGSKEFSNLQDTKKMLKDKYQMREENLEKYLGVNMQVNQSGSISLFLEKYANKLQQKFQLSNKLKQHRVPMTVDPNIAPPKEGEKIANALDITEYLGKVGSLMFSASTTRPDLQLACSKLAQGNKNPSELHRDQAQRALKYFCDTPRFGLTYRRVSDDLHNVLYAYCDANWAKEGDTKSQTGYLVYLNGAPISWGSKKQTGTVTSSCDAEIVAAISCAKEVVHLRRQLALMGYPQEKPTVIYTDSLSLIPPAESQKNHSQVKHLYRLHWLQEQVTFKQVNFKHVRSGEQWADFLTKVLAKGPFTTCRDGAQVLDVPPGKARRGSQNAPAEGKETSPSVHLSPKTGTA